MLRHWGAYNSLSIQCCWLWPWNCLASFLGLTDNMCDPLIKPNLLTYADLSFKDYAYIMYAFRMKYPGVHNIADAAGVVGGPVLREIACILFLLTWVLVETLAPFHDIENLLTSSSLSSGSVFIGLAQGLKILAGGKGCSVVWTLVAAICSALVSSIPTLGKLAYLTWIGFASIFTAVFIVV